MTDEHIAKGVPPAEARLTALRAMNGLEQRKEECRDTRRVRLVEDVVQDLRYAVRTLLRSRGFTAAAIVTLALGIGASVAVFTVVNGVLLRPMPFPEPDRLFLLSHAEIGPFMSQPALADHQYLEFRASNRLFSHLALFTRASGASLTAPGDPSIVRRARVTAEFFAALRVGPATGRTFEAGDDQPGRDHVALLSDGLWRSAFGADPAITGREITLDGIRHSVVGVMPPGFNFPGEAAVWTPMVIRTTSGNSLMYSVLGRLKPGVPVAQAQAEFDTIVRRTDKPETDARWISGVIPLKELLVRDIRRPLEIFAGRRRLRAAHRVRERGEPAARPRHRPAARDCRPRGAWRQPRATRPSTAHGEHPGIARRRQPAASFSRVGAFRPCWPWRPKDESLEWR